ncbi:site-specific integrase [bacterium]|nr:site-specific integrase [bacterium]
MTAYLVKQGRNYRARVKLSPSDKLVDVTLRTRDHQIAKRRLASLVRELENEKDGYGLPRAVREAAARPLPEHLADYARDLAKRKRSPDYVYNIERVASLVCRGCGWVLPKDVTADSFIRWREGQQKAAKTLNQYLAMVSGLLTWMRKAGRVEVNPLESVGRSDTRGNEKRVRRVLTGDEVRALLAAAGSWRPVYLLALVTGLRRNELASLIWEDVHLEGPRPLLSLRASTTKNRRKASPPLHREAVLELQRLRRAGVSPADLVFRRMPRMYHHQAILKAAKIAYKDELGRQADFHALRHTFNTTLAAVGVAEPVRMALMRHETPGQTRGYTDLAMVSTVAAIAALPWFSDGPPHGASQILGGGGQGAAEAGRTLVVVDSKGRPVDVGGSQGLAATGTEGRSGGVGWPARIRT